MTYQVASSHGTAPRETAGALDASPRVAPADAVLKLNLKNLPPCLLASGWTTEGFPSRRRVTMDAPMTENFVHLRPNEIATRAPVGPGLYAWYGVVNAGAADWALTPQNGVDVGEHNSRSLLKSHTHRYEGAELVVRARGHLAADWAGVLKDQTGAELLDVLETGKLPDGDSSPAPKLQTTLQSPAMREAMFQVLQAASPILAAPLYIGVATSLRKRLVTHTRQLSWLWGMVSKDRSYLSVAEQDTKSRGTFAFRAVSQGFSVDSVRVSALEISRVAGDGLTDEELRTVAEACEWLLNRWHRPALGRR